MNLRRRLKALERWLISEPTLLMMPDGSTASIPSRGENLLRLFQVAVGGHNNSPEQAAQWDLIRRSVDAKERAAVAWLNWSAAF
jgi:hypothetical protein